MSRKVYALLVGIDGYPSPVRSLRGCVNDIQEIETLLAAQGISSGDTVISKILINAAATRAAIIQGFREHLAGAAADDVALFYFSGHGSQQYSPPEFWHLEPDRLDETLVCYDSRRPGGWDLADKELAQLISEISANKAHLVVILDCCHSGSGTRGGESLGIRRVPTDNRERPLTTFLAGLLPAAVRAPEEGSGWVALPKGRHILLAACRSDEEAKEYSLGGKPRGVFSHFLAETLQQSSGAITYRELFKRVNALVRNHVALQSPQMEATEHSMLDENFLGGTAIARGRYFSLTFDANVGWNVDAGAVHGIPQAAPGDDTAIFAIFPQASIPHQWREMQGALGTARVQRVEPHCSLVEVSLRTGTPAENHAFKAILIALPLPPLDVQFTGDQPALELARKALLKAGAGGGPSLLVRESPSDTAALRLAALESGNYRILRPVDGLQLVSDIEGFDAASALNAVNQLEHIARWTRISELRNPATRIETKEIRMEIYTAAATASGTARPIEGGSLRMTYARGSPKPRQPSFTVKLVNCSDLPLYFSLVGLIQNFGVQASLLPGGSVRLEPNGETWANDAQPIWGEVSNELWNAGVSETRDVLKLIVSTEECDVTLLEQGELDQPVLRAKHGTAARSVGVKSTLNRLLNRVQTRGLSTKPADDEAVSDWITLDFTITTVRPQESVVVSKGHAASIYPSVTLLSHPSLDAKARLTAAPLASRDTIGGLVLPPLLRDDPEVSHPFLLSSSRGGEPGLSVLELFDVQNHKSVTPEQPLKLKIQQPLAPGEHLLPVTHDGEFFLPIGRGIARGDHIEVVIEALPQPINTRSLFGAVRIFFQKIISQQFGTPYRYPLLAAFARDTNGTTQLTGDPAEVQASVAAADRIVLYIHGIIGETRDMAESAAGMPGPPRIPGLRDRYDLALTFDYENLHTPIEQTARLLKQRLADAGLNGGHGKTLHIVAHSMGGLVARWFIEREGGNKLVQHLVMLGTPNGGSPWATLVDWAITALSIGLNGLSSVAWPAQVLGSLVSAIEKVDVTLDQMNPGSAFLRNLHASPDPRIPYTIIAGNTSLNPVKVTSEKTGVLAHLLRRLKSENLLHLATAPLFFGKPNDIAVSVANTLRIPGDRFPVPAVKEVPCDHLTYFTTEAGLLALAKSLPPRR